MSERLWSPGITGFVMFLSHFCHENADDKDSGTSIQKMVSGGFSDQGQSKFVSVAD